MADQPSTNSSLPSLIIGLVVGLVIGWLVARATAPEPEVATVAATSESTELEAEDIGGSFEITRVPVGESAAPSPAATTPVTSPKPAATPVGAQSPEPEPVVEEQPLPASKVDLRLLGTMMGEGEDRIALIENVKRERQGVYVEGATLLPGVTLEKVENERVVINRKGKLEELRLARAKLNAE